MFLAIGAMEEIVITGIILTLILFAITKVSKHKKEEKIVPIGFYLCATSILLVILNNFIVITR